MHKTFLTYIFSALYLFAPQVQATQEVSINEGWKFLRMEAGSDLSKMYSDSEVTKENWEQVRLPHTARIEPLLVNDQWQGICWYQKVLDVPADFAGKTLILEFEAAMNVSEFWINGKSVIKHYGGYLPVVIDATEVLKAGEPNVIAVRLDNRDSDITGPKPLKILDFNMYSGLYRNARLIVKEPVHITHPILADKVAGGGVFVTTPGISEKSSEVSVKTHVANTGSSDATVSLRHQIFHQGQLVAEITTDQKKLEAHGDFEVAAELKVPDAKLWSPDSPNLYDLKTEVIVAGEVLDTEQTRFGIRSFELRGLDFYINGEKTYLRGVNRHQEYPFIGYALSDNAHYRDAKKIKDAGFNAIRLSHYPHSPAFMRACDELGLVLIDAILGWQFYQDTDAFRNNRYEAAKHLIRRDRNHASVAMWEVSLNETDMPIPFMEEMHRIVHTELPEGNVYSAGWMHEVYDIFFQARQHRILHNYEPELGKPYFVSEYGDWEYYSRNAGLNQHSYGELERLEKSSRQLRGFGEKRLLQQAFNVQEAYNDNLQTIAFGDAYWVMYDYNRGYAEDLEASGIMDIFRLPKFAYSFYQSQQNAVGKVVLEIASYWNENSALDVKVYSNCDEVALYLNDELVAKQHPDTDENSSHLPEPPFTFQLSEFKAGTLKAVGYKNGKLVAEDLVHTPGDAVALKLALDESGKAPEAGVNDVMFLYISAVDSKGTVVPDYAEKLDLAFSGDVELLNVEPVQAEAGIATALIRIGETGGPIKATASADGLKTGGLAFNAAVK
ncbi:MAG: glycoside hydrolase family 2 TIM barrel-domain containing protein [Verrucomicrobiota bacterium]